MRISLGLGSNIGDRAEYLRQAIDYLLAVEGVDADFLQQSSIIETPAMLPENAPKEWNIPFLNQDPQAHMRHFVVQPLCEIWQECLLANGLTAQENMELMRQIWLQPS